MRNRTPEATVAHSCECIECNIGLLITFHAPLPSSQMEQSKHLNDRPYDVCVFRRIVFILPCMMGQGFHAPEHCALIK